MELYLLAWQAIHIEVTFNLDADSFVLALIRLVVRCGKVRSVYSDIGSNFIGAERELKKAYSEMNDNKIQSFMESIGRDWIKWHKNPPFASHMGGVWETQIRSAYAILASMLKTHGKSLDNEALLTLMTEVEGILNSRPLTVEMINEPSSFQPLAPANILTMKSEVVISPPGKFLRPDLYCRRRWRRVQHIANEFWSRWRKKYLHSLQERQKWNTRRRNFVIGDVVLLKTMDVLRNKWPMVKVTATKRDQNGLVRSIYLKIGDRPEREKAKNIVE